MGGCLPRAISAGKAKQRNPCLKHGSGRAALQESAWSGGKALPHGPCSDGKSKRLGRRCHADPRHRYSRTHGRVTAGKWKLRALEANEGGTSGCSFGSRPSERLVERGFANLEARGSFADSQPRRDMITRLAQLVRGDDRASAAEAPPLAYRL